ncbi:MAG: hypothetical protein LBN27_02765 [Prevotellaceae bacterium]|nr:hypothetical protein [Prevotellaceae bacterium]
MKHTLYILLLAILLTSCHKSNRFAIDTDESDLQIKIERFDRDFIADTAKTAALQAKYATFFRIYTQEIMKFGSPDDSSFYKYAVQTFLKDSAFHNAYETELRTFADVADIEAKLTGAFRYIKHYFPQTVVPRVIMYVSGFNQPVVATDSVLALSADNYLGKDFSGYKTLVYEYQLEGMKPENVPCDYVMVWLAHCFPFEQSETLLDNMLYQGKIMYLLEAFMPEEPEHILIAYTPEQIKWCRDNEKQMWTMIAEKKHLFSQDYMLLKKYLDDAPYTVYFPEQSPGRAGAWIGWQIVRAYMKNNTGVTLQELMAERNYRKILEKSGYRP